MPLKDREQRKAYGAAYRAAARAKLLADREKQRKANPGSADKQRQAKPERESWVGGVPPTCGVEERTYDYGWWVSIDRACTRWLIRRGLYDIRDYGRL